MKGLHYCVFIVFSFVRRFIFIFNRFFLNKPTEIKQIQPINNYKSQSELDKIYIERNRSQFLIVISTILNNKTDHQFNSNIDPIFYNIKEYTQLLENDNVLESIWKTRLLLENTPRGNIIMFFDVYKFGFAYYSDQHIPPFILNAVAMKYVKMFRCFDFFLDNQLYKGVSSPLFMLQNNLPEPIQTKHNPNKSTLNNNPYARFKKYNNLPITPMGITTNILLIKPEPLNENVHKNKFMYLGKITNCCLLKQNKLKQPRIFCNTPSKFDNLFSGEKNIQKVVLNYKDFKNIKLNLS